MKRRLCIAVLAGGLALAGCGDDDDTAASDSISVEDVIDDDAGDAGSDGDGGTSVDAGADGVTIEGSNGDSFTTGAALPDGFPTDTVKFPLGFTIGQVQEQDVAGSVGWTVLGTVSEPISPVREELVLAYGEPTSEAGEYFGSPDDELQIAWTDQDGYDISFDLTRNADGDTVAVVKVQETA